MALPEECFGSSSLSSDVGIIIFMDTPDLSMFQFTIYKASAHCCDVDACEIEETAEDAIIPQHFEGVQGFTVLEGSPCEQRFIIAASTISQERATRLCRDARRSWRETGRFETFTDTNPKQGPTLVVVEGGQARHS